MKAYDNYSPEIPVHEEVPPVEGILKETKESPRRRAKKESGNKRAKQKDAKTGDKKRQRNDVGALEKVKLFFTSTTTRLVSGICIGGLGLYMLVAFISYFTECIKDQAEIANNPVGFAPHIGNAAGEGGARLAEFLINETFGLGSFVIIVWLICIALKMLLGVPKFKTVNFTIKCIVALITVSLIIGLFTLGFDSPVNWGGYHGRYANEFVIHFLGWIGAVILCLMLVAIFIVICLRDFINWIIRKRNAILEHRRVVAEAKAEREALEREREEMARREAEDAVKAGEAADPNATDDTKEGYVEFGGEDSQLDRSVTGYDIDDEPIEEREKEPHSTEYSLEDEEPIATEDEEHPLYEDSDDGEPGVADEVPGANSMADEVADEDDNMVVNVNQISQVQQERKAGPLIPKLYKFPPAELLRPGEEKITVDASEQMANKEKIRETLLYHKIPITSIEATVGPTVTLYEIRPDQGIKIARIKNLADDIALSLSAVGVRIIAPIPGKGTVGIEVANEKPQTVSMRTVIQSRKYVESKYKLPVALGCTIGNDVYIADLTKMPHLLVAGATGQGKSVGLNAIIASLLYKKRPDELKFVMIDPKEVEFSLYAKIEKHYLAKIPDAEEAIVTDMSKVVATLSSLCVEMDNRYKLLRAAQVRNIEEYNDKLDRLSAAEGHRFLPYIVVVVDEFADLIMTSGKEVETPIARLAQKARAVGMHVIIATQRPSTNVITGIIKANFPVRIAFKVTSGVDSKTILDTTGAQQLIGRGDMLISSNSQMVRVQCAFIDTPEVEEICDYIERQPFNSGAYILPEPSAAPEEGGGGHDSFGGDRDPLFEDAARYVVGSGTASTSALQRRYSIGYNRAGKIMDQLESYGIVGPSQGGKPRDVKVDHIGLEDILGRV